MDSDSEGAGDSPPSSPWSSDGGRDSGRSDATSATATATIPATPPKSTRCQQAALKNEFNQIAAYLAKEKSAVPSSGSPTRTPNGVDNPFGEARPILTS
jgi:hypothetical protein